MKTKKDLLVLVTRRESINIEQKFKWCGFEYTNFNYDKAFILSMKRFPHLINEYKHLVGSEIIKEVLEDCPLTKLYLKD